MIGIERKREILLNIAIPKETVETAIRRTVALERRRRR
jgi:hypothetical protein